MKLNWKFLVIFSFAAFVSGMIFLAVKSFDQNLDLVKANYYEEAVSYQDVIDAKSNAINAGSKIKLFMNDDKNLQVFTTGIPKSISGKLYFYKPDNANDDFTADFKTDESGNQILSVDKLTRGHWKVEIDWEDDGKKYHDINKIFVE